MLIEKMKVKPSHITFKISQAINFIKNFTTYSDLIVNREKPIPIGDLIAPLNTLAIKQKTELIRVLPPPFFSIDIKFDNGESLKSLSSGEQQKIYSSATWIYHLLNLNSVGEEAEARYSRFKAINIVFDEIELYYHPELQRTFIKDFLENIDRLTLADDIVINCILITHSPFILSDIPNQNILFLKTKDEPLSVQNENQSTTVDFKTFGANIHELLMKAFFMKNTLGEVALKKIASIIQFHKEVSDADDIEKLKQQYMDKKEEFHFVVENLGEEYIERILRNHIFKIEEKLLDDSFIDAEVKALQERIDLLNEKRDAQNKIP
jgi:hypothetical protein